MPAKAPHKTLKPLTLATTVNKDVATHMYALFSPHSANRIHQLNRTLKSHTTNAMHHLHYEKLAKDIKKYLSVLSADEQKSLYQSKDNAVQIKQRIKLLKDAIQVNIRNLDCSQGTKATAKTLFKNIPAGTIISYAIAGSLFFYGVIYFGSKISETLPEDAYKYISENADIFNLLITAIGVIGGGLYGAHENIKPYYNDRKALTAKQKILDKLYNAIDKIDQICQQLKLNSIERIQTILGDEAPSSLKLKV